MSTIRFKKANCKNCYKCLRSCPVKAIAFKNGQAEIIEEECIVCGKCLSVCPQNAKTVKNDTDKVKKYISKKEKVYASIAPSFISSFKQGRTWIYAALKRLGFAGAEETAAGAAQVSKCYEKLLNQKKMDNIITTACPSVVFLLEKHYPELIPQMAPVVSPMIAHAKMLRETYGQKIRVVFIGPCISKIEENKELDDDNAVDAVITFEELHEWIKSEGIDESTDLTEELKGIHDGVARIYPMPGGILATMDKKSKKNYHCISVDGIDRCREVFDSIINDGLSNYFIEANSCAGGCIGGPHILSMSGGYPEARKNLMDYVRKEMQEEHEFLHADMKINLSRTFSDCSKKAEVPSDAVIEGILNSIGKFSKEDELNCGACGYGSCREKAIAVYQEKAQLYMCLPYMRERAESMSDLILNTTPNAIIAFDRTLLVQEINESAALLFKLDKKCAQSMKISEILECEDIDKVLKKKKNIYNKKYYYKKYDITVEQSIIYVEKQNIAVIVLKDITEEEKKRHELYALRSETVDIAQKVIEKQMRVAQEIASLLGETTAETKITLTKLKNIMMAEMSDDK